MHAPNRIWTWETEKSRFFSPPFSCPHTIFSIFHLWFRGYISGEKSFIFPSSISSEKSYGLRAPFSMNNPLVYELYFRWEIPLPIFSEKFIHLSHEKSIYLYIGSLLYCVPMKNSSSLLVTLMFCKKWRIELGRRCWRPIYGGIDDF